MSEDAIGGKGRWTVAALGAIGVVATVLFMFRMPAPPIALPTPAPSLPAQAAVKMARPDASDVLLKEETELRDLRPLFLPTQRNAALPDPRLEAGQTFLDQETLKPLIGDADVRISEDLPLVVTLNSQPLENARPIDALAPDLTLLGFGRGVAEVTPFRARGGFVEVVSTRDGQRVLAEKLPVAARPPDDKPWTPIEFLAVIDTAGLASPLVVTEGSRVEEVDAHFRDFLVRNFRIGDRLEPGFYRITVAP
jgi:hypothetical protein